MSEETRKVPTNKQKISADNWEKMLSEAETAKEFLTDKKFEFIRKYLSASQSSILERFARESINDVTIQDTQMSQDGSGVSRTVTIPAKKEYSHLAGEFKFIERFINDLQKIVELPIQAKNDVKNGSLIVDEVKEDG